MSPDDTVVMAARVMEQMDVGMLPICDSGRLVGIVTDRDIVVRGVTKGQSIETTPLAEVMSMATESCTEDQLAQEVVERMRQAQVRRLPVVDAAQRVIGVVSLGDLAVKYDEGEAGGALEAISEPAEPARADDYTGMVTFGADRGFEGALDRAADRASDGVAPRL